MSYRIIAFIIAAGLIAVFLATGTDSVRTESGSAYASSEVSQQLSEFSKNDAAEDPEIGKRNSYTIPDTTDSESIHKDSLLPESIHLESIHLDSTQPESIHPDSIFPMDVMTGSDIMAPPTHFARVAFSHQCLKVERDGQTLALPENKELLPGDIVETCSRHFALIDFSPAGTMILYPASRATIVSDGSELILKSAEFLFENDLSGSSFPDIVRCFDESLYHNHDAPPVSFGVHCRGESGMILTSKTGTLWWSCRDAPCEVPAGQGLMGRITTANYSRVTLPAQPLITTAYVVPQRQAKDPVPDSDPKTAAEVNSEDKSGFSAAIMWNRVDMADQYLVHIYQDTEERFHHVLTLHHKNRFTAELPGAGIYIVRVMAVDFYGVSGEWSAPFSFTAEHDELVGEDSLDAFSPGNTVQSENTVQTPNSDSLLPDNGDRYL
ncbi:MAG: hypothetical protein EA363_06015 [Balneolaceae bacterium]|nr:MAG: hypothetical protein EA363_06015 [Balneolaceae bacterium]